MNLKLKNHPGTLQKAAYNTLVEVLRTRVEETPGRVAYTFLQEGMNGGMDVSFAELDERARAIAAYLQERSMEGERALILLPYGLAYIATFFGCLYAGVIAVPGFPPRFGRLRQKDSWFHRVARDAQPRLVFTLPETVRTMENSSDLEELSFTWIDPNQIDLTQADEWHLPSITSESTAFLQYTSGSTSDPRGVVLTHGNLLHNQKVIQTACCHDQTSTVVSWLPLHHDMGLIGTVIHPAYLGARSVLMPPTRFLQEPVSWLQAITQYRGRSSSAPNFAYELCIRKVSAEQKASLDLTSWNVAINGAEPVRPETMARFAAAFNECGFSPRAFYPSYGLAESTLMVTGARRSDLPLVKKFSAAALEKGLVREQAAEEAAGRLLAGCGHSVLGQEVTIVNPETLKPAGEQEVGEIWVGGPSVAWGYWGRPEESEAIFRARITDETGKFLRTGDLGFLLESELFITGRLKDLIIVRGRNLYPQDLELTIQRSHPSVRPGFVAVFAAKEDPETIVAVVEADRGPGVSGEEVIRVIRETTLLEHGVFLRTVVLIRSGTIPKTTSGKIRRSACRDLLAAGELQILMESSTSADREGGDVQASRITRAMILEIEPALRYDLVRDHLQKHLQNVLKLPPQDLKADQTLISLGMDSLAAAQLAAFLNQELGVALDLAELLQETSLGTLTSIVVDSCNEKDQSPAVRKTSESREIPLSYGQHGLWVLHQIAPDSTAYVLANAVRVKAGLNVECLRDAFREVMARHQMLRATFFLADGGPAARVHEVENLVLENHFQHRRLSAEEAAQANQLLNQEARRPFALDQEAPIRLTLFSLPNGESLLLLALHHIAADLISIAIIVDELNALYVSRLHGVPALIPEPRAEYADFVQWQRELIESPRGQNSYDYWRKQLKGDLAVLELPADRPRPLAASYRGASEHFHVAAAVSEELRKIARAEQATLFMAVLAAFQAFLHRISGQEDLQVGVPINGRKEGEFARVVGYCVNTVVLRSSHDGARSFTAHLAKTRRTALEAFAHQDYPFPLLVEKLHPERNPAAAPIFQTMFAWQKLEGEQSALASAALGVGPVSFQLAGLKTEPEPIDNTGSQFDLTLMMAGEQDGMLGVFKYSADLFDAATVRRLADQFSVFLEQIVRHPESAMTGLRTLSDAERDQLLSQWTSNTVGETAVFRCAHEFFEEHASRDPEAPALIMGDRRLTYAKLNARANQFARYMRNLEIGVESRVAICLERCPEMVIAILGIWKAGAAYVPLDPCDPPERLAALVKGAAIDVMIVHEKLLGRLSEPLPPLVLLDLDAELIALEDDSNLDLAVPLEALAYVIHTSGSTGVPKGVMIQHASLANLVEGLRSIYQRLEQRRLVVGLNAPLVFDSSVKQLLALAMGHTLCVVPEEARRNGEALLAYAKQTGIEVLDCTPTMAQILIEIGFLNSELAFSLFLGGEAIPPAMWQALADSAAPCFNLYGPTECTVDATACALGSRAAPAIGRALAGTNVYVLNERMEPVPAGAAGELYVGGLSVGRGYLNDPEMTAERFLPDPFNKMAGTRMYRSGDRTRYSRDGNFEFIDRVDRQVKVRGFRIELGEIEGELHCHPSVRESVVVLRTDTTGIKRLIGYVVTEEQHGSDHYRQFLAQRLPEHMVPVLVLRIPGIPVNANGKRDYAALPLPEIGEREQEKDYVPPRSGVEKYLVELWSDMLRTSPIGIADSFFALGGDSLQATRMVAQVQADFATSIPLLALFFQEPTIEALSRTLAHVVRQSPVLSER